MSTNDNKKVVEEFFTGGGTDPLSALSDDVRWTVIGTTAFSGTYNGKQEVIEKLFGPLMAKLQGPGSTDVKNVVAEGDFVVVQSQAKDRITHDGRPYNNTYCVVLRLRDGKVVEVDEYCDTELITAAFGSKEAASAGAG